MLNKQVRYYPYPVLAYDKEDFHSSNFALSLNVSSSGTLVYFDCSIALVSEIFNDFIERGDIEICVVIECAVTKLKRYVKIPYDKRNNYRITVETDDLNEKVETTAYLVAKKSICFNAADAADLDSFYASDQIEYPQFSIVGYSSTHSNFITKKLSSNGNVSSILSLIPNNDETAEIVTWDYFGDHITIKLPRKVYETYVDMNGKMVSTRQATIVLSVLTGLIQKLSDPDVSEEYGDTLWFHVINDALKNAGISDIKSDDIDASEIAQRILGGNVICRAFEELATYEEEEEEENANQDHES